MIPQIIVLVLWVINLILTAKNHGKYKSKWGKKNNIWLTSMSILITASILYWGGFFNVFLK